MTEREDRMGTNLFFRHKVWMDGYKASLVKERKGYTAIIMKERVDKMGTNQDGYKSQRVDRMGTDLFFGHKVWIGWVGII